MLRKSFTLLLAFATAVFTIEPALFAQVYQEQSPYYGSPAPQQGYPQGPAPQAPYGQYPAGPTGANTAADAPDPAADQQHGAVRISVVQGDVNVKRGDTGEFVAAVVNAPLVTQDRLQTSPGSRAEVELDSGSLLRLGANTDAGFADIEYRRFQVQLGAGTVIYRVLRASRSDIEVDTPSVALRALGPGEYRISVLDDGTTQITVRSGAAEIFGPRGSEHLDAGRTTLVRGNASDPEFQTGYEIARDQLDDWSATRDAELMASQSYRYVNPDINGAADLDRYGTWVQSQYGEVWAPQSTGADWAPYSDGNWVWQNYYGWTWVDAAPWGWAPFHYGRWFWNGGYGWCWWPGAVGASAFWSPAVVGFFGWGGLGLGWAALAPYEVFHPWWGHGWGYGYRGFENYYHGYDAARVYRNAALRGGAHVATYGNFGRLGQRFAPADRGQLANASFFRGPLPVAPTRASYQFSNRQAFANPRLSSAASRQFFQHQQFRSSSPAQSGFVGGQRTSSGTGFTSFRPQSPARGTGVQSYSSRPSGASAPSRSSNGGWQHFGDPGNLNGLEHSFAPGNEHSPWHSFGQPPAENRGGYANGFRSESPAPSAQPRGVYPNFGSGFNRGSGAPSFAAPRYSAPENAPRYNAPSVPRYSPPSMPHYSTPSGGRTSAPHYSAPSSRGGGGGGQRSGGGGGGHSSGGGGHHH